MTAKVIGLTLEKGGVGKTTSSINLAVELARQEPPTGEGEPCAVLAIDADPQANLTRGLGVTLTAEDVSTYEVLLNPDYGVEYAVKRTVSGVDVVASAKAMAGVELELVNAVARESRLKQALREAEGDEKYAVESQAVDNRKFIVLDSPPNLGLLTMNVMVASDVLIIPMQLQVFALDAMDQLEATIKLIRKLNRKAEVGGIFCTMYDSRTNLSAMIAKEVRQRYGSLVFETMIPMNTKLAEAPALGKPIQDYAPQSAGAQAYASLAREFKRRFGL